MTMVHNVVNLVSLDPQDVPVIPLDLLVASFSEGFQNTITESGLELNLRKVGSIMIFFNVLSKVFGHLFKLIIKI